MCNGGVAQRAGRAFRAALQSVPRVPNTAQRRNNIINVTRVDDFPCAMLGLHDLRPRQRSCN